jgi:Protein of unknown function (DUF1559)/Prokaryotic N-terminal methylation motif
MRSSGRRHGFTLIELSVAIAIIDTFVSLLLPTGRSVRDAATRAECQNNLKPITLACHSCNDSQGRLPRYRGTVGGPSYAVLCHRLPFLAQRDLGPSTARSSIEVAITDGSCGLTDPTISATTRAWTLTPNGGDVRESP